jgi:hypothetical protein
LDNETIAAVQLGGDLRRLGIDSFTCVLDVLDGVAANPVWWIEGQLPIPLSGAVSGLRGNTRGYDESDGPLSLWAISLPA